MKNETEKEATEERGTSALTRLLCADDFEEQDTVEMASFTCYVDGIGFFTVIDRETGFSFVARDTESGFRDLEGKFWLASGMFDIRKHLPLKVSEAINLIKQNSSTCQGV